MRTLAGFLRNFLPGIVLALLLSSLSTPGYAQSSSASLSVTITDPSGAMVSDANVVIRNSDTNQEQEAHSGRSGTATFSFLKPGHYSLTISKEHFSEIAVDNIVLNVGDDRKLQQALKVGSSTESVNVDGSGLTLNTTDASVSTVIDRKFVENTPLNGRSFQSLILLTPGSVTNSPQRAASTGFSGEFSVNGQRTESNNYSVDGVSANIGVSTASNGGSISGSLPSSTALGTTQALVSVDALQEFRVESSTYSAEYGRNPGGQFAMVTRAGTNVWHGTAFDYFRNDALDANNWFNDNTSPITAKTAERQNDFGGTLGGPILIPHQYNGTNKSFFFFSYEGLRLVQPVAATINYVPTMALRQSVSGPLQQALNAFPLPTPNTPDLGNGLGEFIGSWSTPSSTDSASLRLDQSVGQRLHLFFRFNDAPSSSQARRSSSTSSTPSSLTTNSYSVHTYTLGATTHINGFLDDDFRLNYSTSAVTTRTKQDSFGGSVPVDLDQLQGAPDLVSTYVTLSFEPYYESLSTAFSKATQQQWNLVNTLNILHGHHTMKIGVDWRRISPTIAQVQTAQYQFSSAADAIANSVDFGLGLNQAAAYPVYLNFSSFAQDEWKLNQRLALSLGIRWDVNPAPGVSKGLSPYTVLGLNNYSTMTLAPQGTSLWKTTWFNLAPRLGLAYKLFNLPGRETVLRGGGGVFFDTGQQIGSYGFQGPGFEVENDIGADFGIPAAFPTPTLQLIPAISQPPSPPFAIYANPPHLQLPYTLQWNAAVEQALGTSQSLTVSYVGANGRKLLEEAYSNVSQFNPDFSYVYDFKNGLTSSYNSLQIKYQRQVAHGLEVLGSYTWSHAIDFGSFNAAFPYQRGNSDYDVRNNATAAISYDIPHLAGSLLLSRLATGWGVDGRFTGRTGFPITLNGNQITDPTTGQQYYGGLNRVQDVPLYVSGSTSFGRQRLNPAAFSLPSPGQYGNAPRNFVTGFGAVQTDIALRRSFTMTERLHAQFRAEAFNVFNHPIFGMVNPYYGETQFGQATNTLSQSLGVLSPLYQTGGPRSLQLALKLSF